MNRDSINPMSETNVLLIEGSDFESFPVGGQLTMAKSIMKLFGDRVSLVGINRPGEPIGRWIHKQIAGASYQFFPVCAKEPSWKKPVIPARITFLLALRRFRAQILESACNAAFIQSPEAMIEVSRWNLGSICYWFPGVENPLRDSRYSLARPFWRCFDRLLFSALGRASLILAAADGAAIDALIARSRGRLLREKLTQLPTCVDMTEFYPALASDARKALGLPLESEIFVNLGRISRLKGWDLLVDAFEIYCNKRPEARLIFVGDGEERPDLMRRLGSSELSKKVMIAGFQTPMLVRRYLAAADVAVFGSRLEGLSVSMLEALACGKAIVSTAVSGVRDLILPGQNGFILENREPTEFAAAMRRAIQLQHAPGISASIAARFDISRLGERLAQLWTPFRLTVAKRKHLVQLEESLLFKSDLCP
jgi:glycosyltransferase involved in cell wall biosynthesis